MLLPISSVLLVGYSSTKKHKIFDCSHFFTCEIQCCDRIFDSLPEKSYICIMNYALITGAGSGIGFQYACELAARGYGIMVVSNNAEQNERAVATLRQEFGVEAVAIYADLAKADAAERLYAEAVAIGEVEVLVSNAGVLQFSTLERTAESTIERIIALHCTTPSKLCRLFAADMRRRGRGYIVLMSSITAYMPYPTISLYAATKRFICSFGQSLWFEMRGSGVRVCTVFPSAVDTPFYKLDDKMRRLMLCLGLMQSPESVARKALKATFCGRRRCLPGLLTKIIGLLCAVAPAWALLPILKIPAVKRILERV